MARPLTDYRLFLKEFRRTFRTTGAILPSSRMLARALTRNVPGQAAAQRILEVGPGTGAVTASLVRRMGAQDSLDLVELNDAFVARLNERFASESAFARVAARARVLHMSIEGLTADEPYDLIVSGLPFNNFAPAEVEQILSVLLALLKPGGTLSFFEYMAVRKAKAVLSGRAQRQRLRGVSQVLGRLFQAHNTQRQWVFSNMPPAWVHHVKKSVVAAGPAL